VIIDKAGIYISYALDGSNFSDFLLPGQNEQLRNGQQSL